MNCVCVKVCPVFKNIRSYSPLHELFCIRMHRSKTIQLNMIIKPPRVCFFFFLCLVTDVPTYFCKYIISFCDFGESWFACENIYTQISCTNSSVRMLCDWGPLNALSMGLICWANDTVLHYDCWIQAIFLEGISLKDHSFPILFLNGDISRDN